MDETVIWWIRRDLRLADNAALTTALTRGRVVVPLFVRDPFLCERVHARSARRRAFLFDGLAALAGDLRRRGVDLVVRSGAPEHVVAAVARDAGATVVVAEEDSSPYGRRRDAAVAREVPLILAPGLTVHPSTRLSTAAGKPFTTFGPFRCAWLTRGVPGAGDLLPAPRALSALPAPLPSEDVDRVAVSDAFPSGEAEAQRRLEAFARGANAPLPLYATWRDRLDRDATSVLSPYLRFGMVSARAAVAAASAAGATASRTRTGADVWLSELVWREFYQHVLCHFPVVLRDSFDPRLRRMRWRHAPDELCAWQEGRTGYPVVDAAMRQLVTTGWIHNRARMIVASFLVKDLLIDWRLGAAWFMRQLIDGDPAANSGGWQWTAGTGTDAAPFFRVFNPVLQGMRHDPEGAYVRRWIPELAGVPAPAVHAPWTMTAGEQAAAGCRIGRDYPGPIVAHDVARRRALAAYRACLDATRRGG